MEFHYGTKPRNWHETLGQTLWAYQNSPKDATRTTPFKLVYGHEAVLPVEINLQSIRIQRQNELPTHDYWNMMFNDWINLDEDCLITLENVIRQKEKVACFYN